MFCFCPVLWLLHWMLKTEYALSKTHFIVFIRCIDTHDKNKPEPWTCIGFSLKSLFLGGCPWNNTFWDEGSGGQITCNFGGTWHEKWLKTIDRCSVHGHSVATVAILSVVSYPTSYLMVTLATEQTTVGWLQTNIWLNPHSLPLVRRLEGTQKIITIETYVFKKTVGVQKTNFRIEFRPERINSFKTDTHFVTLAFKHVNHYFML